MGETDPWTPGDHYIEILVPADSSVTINHGAIPIAIQSKIDRERASNNKNVTQDKNNECHNSNKNLPRESFIHNFKVLAGCVDSSGKKIADLGEVKFYEYEFDDPSLLGGVISDKDLYSIKGLEKKKKYNIVFEVFNKEPPFLLQTLKTRSFTAVEKKSEPDGSHSEEDSKDDSEDSLEENWNKKFSILDALEEAGANIWEPQDRKEITSPQHPSSGSLAVTANFTFDPSNNSNTFSVSASAVHRWR
ncbi:hypothetical protein F5Y17DRAFT_474745 [Xylariaceae sp. FL0594]|nr:hypothetical protein F5Y17DRAFT_474745 [Xylariaceae sp. FL0594]